MDLDQFRSSFEDRLSQLVKDHVDEIVDSELPERVAFACMLSMMQRQTAFLYLAICVEPDDAYFVAGAQLALTCERLRAQEAISAVEQREAGHA